MCLPHPAKREAVRDRGLVMGETQEIVIGRWYERLWRWITGKPQRVALFVRGKETQTVRWSHMEDPDSWSV